MKHNYSMPSYFQSMNTVGNEVKVNVENEKELKMIEEEINKQAEVVRDSGKPDDKINAEGQMTAMQRIDTLVDEGTWCPLNSCYNPAGNSEKSTGILNGLGRVNGKWVYIIASDNKKLAEIGRAHV